MIRRARGQALAEYAFLIAIVSAAVLTMRVYLTRGIQAGVKVAADQIGDQVNGIRYESGDRQNKAFASGLVLRRDSGVTTGSNRHVRTEITPEGSFTNRVIEDRATSTGAFGAGVSFYSEVVVDVQ